MPETAHAQPPSAMALAAQAARIAGALAELLDTLPETHARALGDSRAFLRRMAAAHDGWADDTDAPLERLVAALGLSALERDLVVLAGLPDEHEGYAGVLRQLHPEGLPRPTAGLSAQLLCTGAGDRHRLRVALAAGTAVAHGLLRVAGDGPLPDRMLELPRDLWAELAGCAVPPPPATPPATAGLGAWLASDPVARAVRAVAARERCTVLLAAEDGEAARERALALVAAAGRAALPARAAAGDDTDALALHALARDAVPVVGLQPPEAGQAPGPAPLADHPGPVVLWARPGAMAGHGARPLVALHVATLDVHARRAMWRDVLPELGAAAGDLASRHLVEPAVAQRISIDVRARAALDGRDPAPADVAASTRARSSGALPAGIALRRPAAGWHQLVLPPDRLAQLRIAADRLRHQWLVLDEWGFLRERPGARGVRMMLVGPPGTGKTLAAEVLARALGADLMVVDISRVLSKWIGETEQRLAEVFDAAERAQSVLLFDEADALFGRRTEVSDAHDRYANLETAYLLQRLERFEGLAVLATNLRHNIDPAFMRRLEFVVEFDEPGAQEREALWLAHVPDGAPVAGDVDFAQLAARYPVVGGVIRNAAVAAAFLAAADDTAISREHVLAALEREYDKHGRAFPGRPPEPLAIAEEDPCHP